MNKTEKGFFRNRLEVRETPDGLVPVRFTDAQFKAYSRDPAKAVRSFCPSGVTLDLLTDAAWFELDFKVLGNARDYHYFDVCIDHVLFAAPGSLCAEAGGSFRQELPFAGTKRRLTVHLPHCTHLAITDFRLPPGALAEAAPTAGKKLLCLGDSITQGMDALHPSSTYPALLARFLDMECLNQGVGGHTFRADSLDPALPYKPDLITVAYGTNDWRHNESPGDLKESCAEFFDKLVSIFPGTPVIAITPFWRADMGEKMASGTFMEMVETIEKVCGVYKTVRNVSGLGLMPHLPEFMYDKRLHPNETGFLHIALGLARELQEYKF